jgi:hypothetical protein
MTFKELTAQYGWSKKDYESGDYKLGTYYKGNYVAPFLRFLEENNIAYCHEHKQYVVIEMDDGLFISATKVEAHEIYDSPSYNYYYCMGKFTRTTPEQLMSDAIDPMQKQVEYLQDQLLRLGKLYQFDEDGHQKELDRAELERLKQKLGES